MINENNLVLTVLPAQSFGHDMSDNAKANEGHLVILVFEAIYDLSETRETPDWMTKSVSKADKRIAILGFSI